MLGGGEDPNAHHFEAIRSAPAQGIELTLDGAVPSGFSSDYDLFPIEISDNLMDWTPWKNLLRSNQLGRVSRQRDTSAGGSPRRFYRTLTNQFPTIVLPPTGPYAVGRTVRWVELASHSVRTGFRVFVWYPARPECGQAPMRYFEPKLAGNIAGQYGGSAAIFQAAYAHGTQDPQFAAGLTACPVILCAPGLCNPGTDSTDKAEDLASHGFVVIGLDAADTLYSLQPDLAGAMGMLYEPITAFLVSRVKDAVGVLEQLDRWNRGDSLLAGRLDPENVGMFGFSAGGITSIEVARQHPQCKAAVNLDGGVPYDYVRPGYSKAVMIIGNGEAGWDHHRVLREFVESLPKDAYFFRVSGTTHGYFGDYLWYRIRNLRVGTLTKRSVTSFFNKHLRGVDDHFLDNPASAYPEVIDFVRR
jgi:dienelactone hydrolase